MNKEKLKLAEPTIRMFLYFLGLIVLLNVFLDFLDKPANIDSVWLSPFIKVASLDLMAIFFIIFFPLFAAILYNQKKSKEKPGMVILFLLLCFVLLFISSLFFWTLVFVLVAGRILSFSKTILGPEKRMYILIAPYFVIIAIITFSIATATQNPDAYCRRSKNPAQCYSLQAIRQKMPILCFNDYFSSYENDSGIEHCLKEIEPALKDAPNVDLCEDGSFSQQSICYKYFAETNLNISLCEKIPNANYRDSCYSYMSLQSNDASICEKAGSLKDFCYYNVAVKTKEIPLCEKSGQHHDRCCLSLVGDTESRRAIGGNYKDADMAAYRSAVEKQDEDICDKITPCNPTRSSCYESIARAKGDASLCEKVLEKDSQYIRTKNSCYYSIAISNADVSLCANIEVSSSNNLSMRNRCYSKLAEIKKHTALCENKENCCPGLPSINSASPEINKMDQYYAQLVFEKPNPSICEKTTACSDSRINCYKNLARATLDASFCENISSHMGKDSEKYSCYTTMAIFTKDLSVCDKIPANHSNYSNCYANIAELKKDVSICGKIPTSNAYHDSCYNNIAVALRDASLCDKITNKDNLKDDYTPQKCREKIK